MRKTVVFNCVGLTPRLISPQHTPRIDAFVRTGKLATVGPVLPAVTCSVQSTYLTGAWPGGDGGKTGGHGIVGNGWYDRTDSEVKFWKQSNALVRGPKVWDIAKRRDPSFTCANICWWYAMYSTADYTVTPRPMYPADGRKIPDCWTHPPELRAELQRELGPFPLFHFWGPATTIASTQWIADAAIRVDQKHSPALSLVYLPHLDYVLQREGATNTPHAGAERSAAPDLPRRVTRDLRQFDDVVGKLLDYFTDRSARVILLSEYGITPVSKPVHLNRVLRENGLLAIRDEMGRELLDAGASVTFAVADHQVAHVYVNERRQIDFVASILEKIPGVARVLREADKRQEHLDCERTGDLVCLAEPDAWFTYYYWLDDAKAPDFARTVDIHRKPGYDPVELFLDPTIPAPKLKIALTLLKRKLGLRAMMDVIGLDASLVRGSHGVAPQDPRDGAMLATSDAGLIKSSHLQPTDVMNVMLRHLELE
ncbi:MAG: nucleotide pyrophosphatase/phosphodiesterase family protein [Tepidisphaeraceae bacterium]